MNTVSKLCFSDTTDLWYNYLNIINNCNLAIMLVLIWRIWKGVKKWHLENTCTYFIIYSCSHAEFILGCFVGWIWVGGGFTIQNGRKISHYISSCCSWSIIHLYYKVIHWYFSLFVCSMHQFNQTSFLSTCNHSELITVHI